MPRGHADWGVNTAGQLTKQVTDLGELAARLGAISYYERAGETVFVEDWAHGFASWNTETSGTGGAIALVTEAARNGAYSLRLTAGSDANIYAAVSRTLSPLAAGRLGMEASQSFDDTAPAGTPKVQTAELRLEVRTGSRQIYAAVRVNPVTGAVSVRQPGDVFTQVGLLGQAYAAVKTFHTVKFVVDTATEQYLRVFVDRSQLLSAPVAAYAVAETTFPQVHMVLRCLGVAGDNIAQRWDAVILTQNEP